MKNVARAVAVLSAILAIGAPGVASANTGRHFYTISVQGGLELAGLGGWQSEGFEGFLTPPKFAHETDPGFFVPLFRTYNSATNDHFYTEDSGERDVAVRDLGFVDEGIEALIMPPVCNPSVHGIGAATGGWCADPGEASIEPTDANYSTRVKLLIAPLYRLYNPSIGDHFYTSDHDGAIIATTQGYVREGIVGFVFRRQLGNSVGFQRWYGPNQGPQAITFGDVINVLKVPIEAISCGSAISTGGATLVQGASIVGSCLGLAQDVAGQLK